MPRFLLREEECLAQDFFQIPGYCGDGCDLEGVHQNLQHVGGDESREGVAEFYIGDAEVEQGQQNGYCFLFVPGQNHGQGQIIDAAFKGTGQGLELMSS